VRRTDDTSLASFRESEVLRAVDSRHKCLLDTYRMIRRIHSDCALTVELCRRQRRMIEEQREFLKSLSSDGGASVGE